jgi:hypothetical protein
MTEQQTTTITIQDKYNPIKEHVYVFVSSREYLLVWYRQHINGTWRTVVGQHSMGSLQFSNWPETIGQVNGYKEYYKQAMTQYRKAA